MTPTAQIERLANRQRDRQRFEALKALNSTLAMLWSQRGHVTARRVIKAAIRNYRAVQS